MELTKYDYIMENIKKLGKENVNNIDELVDLSSTLIHNLEIARQVDINKLYKLAKTKKEYNIILIEINKYNKNEEIIINLNEYYKNIQDSLSYTLQYQRNKKLKLELKKKKSIYSNK